MMSYLIVIIRPKKLENRLQTHKKSDRTYRWKQKQRKKLNKPTLSVINAGPPDTEYLYYPLNVEGVTNRHNHCC